MAPHLYLHPHLRDPMIERMKYLLPLFRVAFRSMVRARRRT
jgi:hypothetical protein